MKIDVLIIGFSLSALAIAEELTKVNKTFKIIDCMEALSLDTSEFIYRDFLHKKFSQNQNFDINEVIDYENNFMVGLINSISEINSDFLIETDRGPLEELIRAKHLVFALSGSVVSIDKFRSFYGCGISQCASHDGAYMKNYRLAIYGESERVLDEIYHLSKYTDDLILICPNSAFDFSSYNDPLPSLHYESFFNTGIKEITHDKSGQKLDSLKLLKNGQTTIKKIDYLFCADPISVCLDTFINQWFEGKQYDQTKAYKTGIANGIKYNDYDALYLDGKRVANLLLK